MPPKRRYEKILTPQDCQKFRQNPTINPLTGRNIQPNKAIYNDIQEKCNQIDLSSNINPRTGYNIEYGKPAYKHLQKACKDITHQAAQQRKNKPWRKVLDEDMIPNVKELIDKEYLPKLDISEQIRKNINTLYFKYFNEHPLIIGLFPDKPPRVGMKIDKKWTENKFGVNSPIKKLPIVTLIDINARTEIMFQVIITKSDEWTEENVSNFRFRNYLVKDRTTDKICAYNDIFFSDNSKFNDPKNFVMVPDSDMPQTQSEFMSQLQSRQLCKLRVPKMGLTNVFNTSNIKKSFYIITTYQPNDHIIMLLFMMILSANIPGTVYNTYINSWFNPENTQYVVPHYSVPASYKQNFRVVLTKSFRDIIDENFAMWYFYTNPTNYEIFKAKARQLFYLCNCGKTNIPKFDQVFAF